MCIKRNFKKKPEKVLRLKRHLKKKAQNNNEAKNKEKPKKILWLKR